MKIELLKKLIETPSFSGGEEKAAGIVETYMKAKGIDAKRYLNNVWAANMHFSQAKPTLLLCSHTDTVKPSPSYTRDAYKAEISGGKLYGLGSTDAGASLVGLLAAFEKNYQNKNLAYNLIFAAVAQEECSGPNGISALINEIPEINCAIIGEPTDMQMAVAEKALIVIDAKTRGSAGHAAREDGINAIYLAMEDIRWIKNHEFERESPFLGKVKMSVTMIEAGTAHNVVPAECSYVIDVRTTEMYSNEDILDVLKSRLKAEITPRSLRFSPSFISMEHPLVKAGLKLGLKTFGSPTLSDQALLSCPSIKLGIGSSLRSHSADEFVLLSELKEGIKIYEKLISDLT